MSLQFSTLQVNEGEGVESEELSPAMNKGFGDDGVLAWIDHNLSKYWGLDLPAVADHMAHWPRSIEEVPQYLHYYYTSDKHRQKTFTILGSAGDNKLSERYAPIIKAIAGTLMWRGKNMVTGNGSYGIMGAALEGAYLARECHAIGESLAILGKTWGDENYSKARAIFITNDEFTRPRAFAHVSANFLFAPGGFGSWNELSDLCAIAAHEEPKPEKIVLLGRDYWKPLVEFLKINAEEGTMTAEVIESLVVVDTYEEACAALGVKPMPDWQKATDAKIKSILKRQSEIKEQDPED